MARAYAIARELIRCAQSHRVFDLAAQFAYWSLLALFPFAIFLLTLVGYVPVAGLEEQLFHTVERVMPEQAARLVEQTIREVIGGQRGWLLGVALAGALWSATGGIASTLIALNRAHGVEETRAWWRRKLLCMAMTVGAAGLMIVATCGILVGPPVVRQVAEVFGLGDAIDLFWRWARWPLVAALATMALALVYHFLPNVKQRFRLFSVGSVAAVLMWIGVSVGFNAYVRHFHSYTKTYGTLGAAVVLMVWLYLTGVTVILGGEINALFARRDQPEAAREPDTGAGASEPSSTNVPTPSPR